MGDFFVCLFSDYKAELGKKKNIQMYSLDDFGVDKKFFF